jgi:hypothetical protein
MAVTQEITARIPVEKSLNQDNIEEESYKLQ